MKFARRGIGTTILVAVVIIVIAAAAIASYVLFFSTGSSGTTSTSSLRSSSSSSSASTLTTTSSTTSSASSTSPTTAPTTSSISTTSSASSSSQSTTCTSSTQATTGPLASEFNFTGLFNDYSSMTVRWNGTESGNPRNVTSTYTVLSATPLGFRVNVTQDPPETVFVASLFAWRNGSAAWVYINGSNETGSVASFGYLQAMSAFIYQDIYTSPGFMAFLSAPGVVNTGGTSIVMIGGTPVNVTTYEATTLPLIAGNCDNSLNFTKFSLQLGTVAGKATTVLVRFDVAG
ncbi:MAG TPA: hypothetical protein VKF39_05125, partial [Nitrososphaerales archaeon]|nr:hypothetical protein [Nitrososphaerales archaeon]